MDTEGYLERQEEMRKKVEVEDRLPEKIKTVGGADQSFPGKEKIRSCIVVLDFFSMEEVEKSTVEVESDVPYVPGFLSFREGPAIQEAYMRLKTKPDVLFVDGQGIAHPRRVGLASHVGVLLDVPTVGVAKSRLVGDHAPVEEEGVFTPLREGEEILGFAYKSKRGCKPIYVSPGHRVSLHTSMRLAEDCMRGSKLPEPLRLAHICSKNK